MYPETIPEAIANMALIELITAMYIDESFSGTNKSWMFVPPKSTINLDKPIVQNINNK